MELVDQLLAILAGHNPGGASRQLMAAGYTEDEIRGAWNFARNAGYTESTGLGADRLTPAGKARAAQLRMERVVDMDRPRPPNG
jgi:hypothetical protein